MELTKTKFTSLDLPEDIQKGIADAGFDRLTPVQDESLPQLLEGMDLAVQAQTGSGKTAAFLITIFNKLTTTKKRKTKGICPRAIVITPTRELAVQVAHDAELIGKHLGLRILLAYGGVDYVKQKEDIAQGVDLLVGTPGRLIDYLKQRVYHLKDVEMAVIDEADRMFDMGFIADIRFLLRRMSNYDRRQSMLFSATLSDRVMELSYEYMDVPGLIEVTPEQVTAEKVDQVLYHVGSDEKFPLLLGLLQREQPHKTILFINTKRAANMVRGRLNRNGFPSAILSGDVSQVQRLKVLKRFSSGEVKVLVATDVASRGLHVDDVTHVVNYDLPQDAEDYVHRIGRTARAGASGSAISLACENYVFSLPEIEEYIGHPVPVGEFTDEILAEEIPRTPEEIAEDREKARKAREATGKGRGRGRGQRRGRGRSEKSSDSGSSSETKSGSGRSSSKRRRRRRPSGSGAKNSSGGSGFKES